MKKMVIFNLLLKNTVQAKIVTQVTNTSGNSDQIAYNTRRAVKL